MVVLFVCLLLFGFGVGFVVLGWFFGVFCCCCCFGLGVFSVDSYVQMTTTPHKPKKKTEKGIHNGTACVLQCCRSQGREL